MTVTSERYGYIGARPPRIPGRGLGVFTLKEHAAIKAIAGASGAAFGYSTTSSTKYNDYKWLKAGQSLTLSGLPDLLVWLPFGASGAISKYIHYVPAGNFNINFTYILDGIDNLVVSQNIAGNYGPSEWSLFSISTSTAYFGPQYALFPGRWHRFWTYGGTISLV